MLAAMAAMFVIALTIPEAFDDLPGGLPGPVVFAVGYFAVRSLHAGRDRLVAGGGGPERAGTDRPVGPPPSSPTTAADGRGRLGVARELSRAFRRAPRPDPHHRPRRVDRRHRRRSRRAGVSWPIVVASVLGLAISASLWWAYFDVVALVAERVLAGKEGAEQARLARDSDSYLHLAMVAAVILLALGLTFTPSTFDG